MLHFICDLPVRPGVHGPVPEARGPVALPLPLDPLARVVDPDIRCMSDKQGMMTGDYQYYLLYLSLEK